MIRNCKWTEPIQHVQVYNGLSIPHSLTQQKVAAATQGAAIGSNFE